MEKFTFGLGVAGLGMIVVFAGLVLLIGFITILGVAAKERKKPAPKAAPALATGTAGECKLYNVGDREAAMLMAIVANKLGKPLNTLRFKSMKEVI